MSRLMMCTHRYLHRSTVRTSHGSLDMILCLRPSWVTFPMPLAFDLASTSTPSLVEGNRNCFLPRIRIHDPLILIKRFSASSTLGRAEFGTEIHVRHRPDGKAMSPFLVWRISRWHVSLGCREICTIDDVLGGCRKAAAEESWRK
jgi:hypothetical protein